MRVITRLAMAALVIGLGACGDSSGPDGGGNVAGTYTLRTVNGGQVPYTVFQFGTEYKLEILSAAMTVNSNGTWTETSQLRETEGTSVTTETQTVTGTWTQSGNQVTFADSDPETTNLVATFSGGNTLTASGTESGITFTFVYRK
jgi:hypothetical protein